MDEYASIGGVELTPTNCYYVNGAGGGQGTVSSVEPTGGWNAHLYEDPTMSVDYILELKGLVVNNVFDGDNASSGIYMGQDSTVLTLKLTGNSRITTTRSASGIVASCGVRIEHTSEMKVTGDGSLAVTAINGHEHKQSVGFYYNGVLTVESGTLTATGNSGGIDCGTAFTQKGGDIRAFASGTNSIAVQPSALSANAVIIEGGSLLADGTATDAKYGIFADTSLRITGGTVLAQGNVQVFCTRTGNLLGDVLSGYAAPHVATVSTNTSGNPAGTYSAADLGTYKYFRVMPLTAPAAAVPKTGDGSTPLLWLGLALLASAGLTASAALRRRKRQGN